MKKSYGIGKKIWLNVSILIIGYMFSMVFGFVRGKQSETGLFNVSESWFPATQHSQSAVTGFNEQIKLYADAVMLGEPEYMETAREKSAGIQKALESIVTLDSIHDQNRTETSAISVQLREFSTLAHATYAKMSGTEEFADTESEELSSDDSGDAAAQGMGTVALLAEQTKELSSRLAQMNQNFKDGLKQQLAEISRGTRQQRYLNLGLFLAVVIGSLVLVAINIRLITNPINRTIESLTEGSGQILTASAQVSSASRSLAEGATEQAAGLEETSSSLEEMSSMTKQNADNAQQANILASEARQAANGGAEAMAHMSTAIADIQKSSDETAKIIKVIDEIAFQTNLLALNAAVEAARAGEAGKGFAVVAEEVRNLAMRSAEAAKNTSNLIEESVKNSNNGVDIAGEVSKVLDGIVTSVGKTTDLVSEIAAASQEQAQGIDQVNTAVSQMDKVTQQNAANAEESASASEELSAQAESMNQAVQELVGLAGGSRTDSHNTSRTNGRPGTARAIEDPRLQATPSAYHQIAQPVPERHRRLNATAMAQKEIPFHVDSGIGEFDH